jgi:hypothetical protein
LCTSHQKEKLLLPQVRKLLNEIVSEEAKATFSSFESIVIHRDGTLFDSEQRRIDLALQDLRSSGIVRSDARYSMLEISKTAPAPGARFPHERTPVLLRTQRHCFHPSHSKYQLGDFVGAHDFFNLDLDGAAFRIGKRKLEAERREDILSFEEV